MKKILLVLLIAVASASAVSFLLFSSKKSPEESSKSTVKDNSITEVNTTTLCEKKEMVWKDNEYRIDTSLPNQNLSMRVEEKNLESWSYLLKPISGQETEFTECMASIAKVPNFEDMPEELRNQSKGVIVSVGKIGDGDEYTSFGSITMNIQAYVPVNSSKPYDIDAVIQDIADNYTLQEQQDGSFRLSFIGGIGETFDTTKPFAYDFVELNNEPAEVNSSFVVDFISKDKGVSWEPEIVAK